MSTSHLLSSVKAMEEDSPLSSVTSEREVTQSSETVKRNKGKSQVVQSGSSDLKQAKHISWADSSGKKLSVYDDREIGVEKHHMMTEKDSMKKSDNMHERGHIEKSRKSKNFDKHVKLDTISATLMWRKPQPLKNINSVQVTSNELAKQVSRMASVVPADDVREDSVSNCPTPLSDIEQALDMTSQASSSPEPIPFFAPQQEKEVPAPAGNTSITMQPQQSMVATNISSVVASTNVPPPPPPRSVQSFQGATMEVVQTMGLPLFLVGQNVQALQTLAATPNLLSTFLDTNGMYDQVRLLNLVQTLTQNLSPNQNISQTNQVQNPQVNLGQSNYVNQQYRQPQQQQQSALLNIGLSSNSGYQAPNVVPPPPPFHQAPNGGSYLSQSSYSNNRATPNSGRKLNGTGAGYRGDQNGSEANLHISGYGPGTTQADIMALFAPYVHAVEVVTKNNFSFVNTRDPAGAKCAREALNGAILGGRPVRINIATRRAPDPESGGKGGRSGSEGPTPLPRNTLGQIDYEEVADDRGNPATKNLFVAGYGPGTTEHELRAVFGQHCQVSGAVMKGSFAFINTTDKVSAVHAREALTGTHINGAPLRINFAKESGRLGTSFDQTYGPASRSPYMRSHDR